MVAARQGRGQAGLIRLGTLLTLVLLGAVIYYGIPAGQVYMRYWRMEDEMRAQARLSPGLEDAVIRRRLVDRARELQLPAEAERFVIRRLPRQREIEIRTSWTETLALPFFQYTLTLRPEARAPI